MTRLISEKSPLRIAVERHGGDPVHALLDSRIPW